MADSFKNLNKEKKSYKKYPPPFNTFLLAKIKLVNKKVRL